MGISVPGFHISGNFAPLTNRRPRNWVEKGYKITVPYKFKWRDKIGKVECTCQVCEEHYAPYYGVDWYHSMECELMKYIDRRPQVLNLWQYAGRDMSLITTTDSD